MDSFVSCFEVFVLMRPGTAIGHLSLGMDASRGRQRRMDDWQFKELLLEGMIANDEVSKGEIATSHICCVSSLRQPK